MKDKKSDGEYDLIKCRTIASLTLEERTALMTLTHKHENRRSLFQQWLRHPNPLGMYATLVKRNGEIIAWAAVSTRDGWNKGTVGVCVNPEYRRKGIARTALYSLLEYLSTMKDEGGIPEYLIYNQGMELLFRLPIEKHGFKDFYLHLDEYLTSPF